MTQYSDKVEEVRLKQAAENWGKQVKHLHFNNGIEEIKFLGSCAYIVQLFPPSQFSSI